MAYVVARRSGTWEIRESRTTPAGPRSRTLATFRTLTPEVAERAVSRSSRPLDEGDLRKLALGAGAPVAASAPDRAAGELLSELEAGRRPRPVLQALLLDAMPAAAGRTSDSARAAARWVTTTPQRRGETLRDLLLLSDRLPQRRTPARLSFPSIRSAAS
jgi:hypothetical protein